MELFSMLAKLTLDASEFEKQLKAAESEANGMSIGEAKLELDVDDFTGGIDEAQEAADGFTPPKEDNSLDMDESDFTGGIDTAQESADGFTPPDEDHELDMDESDFTEGIDEAQTSADGFTPPDEDNELDMDASDFTGGVDEAQESADSFTPPEEDHELKLDPSDFTQGLQDAEAESESFGSIVGQIFENLKGVLVGTGIVALVGTFVNYLKQGVALAGQNGDKIDKQSQKLHLSAEAYQEWNYALGLCGSSVDDLSRAMRTFDEIQGGKITDDQAAYFEQLGISATDATGKMKSAQELMEETVYALADYTGSDRGLIMEAFFGKNSAGLNALMNSTSAEIKEMKQEAQDLGLVMTDEEVKNAAAYMDATSRLNQSLESLQTSLASAILPMLTEAANTLAKIVALFNWRAGDKSLQDTFDEIDKNGVDALKTMEENEAQATALIDKLAEMGDYWTLDDTGKKTFDQLAAELISLYPQLDEVINNNKNAIWENTEAIKDNITEWTKLEEQRIIDQNLADKRTAIAKQYTDALDKEIQADIKDTEAVGKKVTAYAALDKYFTEGKGKAYLPYLQSIGYEGEMTDELYHKIGSGWIETLLSESGYKDRDTTSALNAWKDTEAEAESLRAEAQSLSAEADAAMESYTQYAEALANKLGITISDTQTATSEVNTLKDALDSLPHTVRVGVDIPTMLPKAIGDAYIPYDMPIYAHRGERILTATEARKYDSGTDFSGLEDRIASAIRSGMSNATVRSYLNGNDITDDVDKNMIRKLKARRFAT